MKEMSYVSYVNVLISAVQEKEDVKKASPEDIKRFVGGK